MLDPKSGNVTTIVKNVGCYPIWFNILWPAQPLFRMGDQTVVNLDHIFFTQRHSQHVSVGPFTNYVSGQGGSFVVVVENAYNRLQRGEEGSGKC